MSEGEDDVHGLGPGLHGLGPGVDAHPLYQVCTASGQVRMVSGQVLMPPPRPIRDVSVAVSMGKKQEHSRRCCRLVLFYDAPEELEQLVNSFYEAAHETIA